MTRCGFCRPSSLVFYHLFLYFLVVIFPFSFYLSTSLLFPCLLLFFLSSSLSPFIFLLLPSLPPFSLVIISFSDPFALRTPSQSQGFHSWHHLPTAALSLFLSFLYLFISLPFSIVTSFLLTVCLFYLLTHTTHIYERLHPFLLFLFLILYLSHNILSFWFQPSQSPSLSPAKTTPLLFLHLHKA